MSAVNKVICGEWEDIGVYPTTQMMRGEITARERLRRDAKWLYDQMVCDRRYEPKDVALMILLQARDR